MPASQQPAGPGRRIVVWGVTGSGKTTLARQLSNALGLTHIELDAIRHARGWDAVDYPEMRRVLAARLDACPRGWVIDGSYSAVHDVYLPHADAIVWLHLPWRVTFWRLLKRTLGRAWSGQRVYTSDGPRETWRKAFFSGDSILWWSITNHRANARNARRGLGNLGPHVRTHELNSPREVASFLREVQSDAMRRSDRPSDSVG